MMPHSHLSSKLLLAGPSLRAHTRSIQVPQLPARALLLHCSLPCAQVKGEIRNNAIGVRGLFATQDIAPGDDILRIPESATINGGVSSSLARARGFLVRQGAAHHEATV